MDAIERTFSGCRVSASEERRRRPLFLLTGKEKFRFQPRILALGKEGRREDGRTEIDISFSFRPPPPLTSFLKCQSEIAEGGKRKENLFLSFFGWLSTPRGGKEKGRNKKDHHPLLGIGLRGVGTREENDVWTKIGRKFSASIFCSKTKINNAQSLELFFYSLARSLSLSKLEVVTAGMKTEI